MKRNRKLLIVCILIPLTAGVISSILSGNGMVQFGQMNQPPLSPPGWLFPVVWTILYILMGAASWLVLISDAGEEEKYRALFVYGLQLAVNFLWSIFFFRFEWYFFSFLWLLLLWILVFRTWDMFRDISRLAGVLLVPYLLWVSFAGYLNLAVSLIN